jgi:hypothetical protein
MSFRYFAVGLRLVDLDHLVLPALPLMGNTIGAVQNCSVDHVSSPFIWWARRVRG